MRGPTEPFHAEMTWMTESRHRRAVVACLLWRYLVCDDVIEESSGANRILSGFKQKSGLCYTAAGAGLK